MKKNEQKPNPPTAEEFTQEAGKLSTSFGWPTKTFERDEEAVVVALTDTDPTFERFVWVYNLERTTLKCMLVSKEKIPEKRQAAVFELCARINEALPFGCLEYSFGDEVLVFRDSCDLDYGPLETMVTGTTARVLNLGRRYESAITATLKGEKPEVAVEQAESAE